MKDDNLLKSTHYASLRFIWLAVLVIVLDQWSKHWIVANFSQYQLHRILPFLNFSLIFNHGAAFSFLNNAGGWQRWLFSGIAIVISIAVLIWMSKTPRKNIYLNIGLALILGGALGNLWDRITLGYVVDFVDFHINTWHFATFNLADSAITIGVILLILDLIFQP